MSEQFKAPAAYLPHRPPMLFLDETCAVTEQSAHCRAYVSKDHALGTFLTEDGLPSFLAVELIAQTIGVWAGYWRERRQEPPLDFGMLLGGRGLEFYVKSVPLGSLLDVTISVLMEDGRMGACEGQVLCGEQLIAQGRINTYQARDEEIEEFFR